MKLTNIFIICFITLLAYSCSNNEKINTNCQSSQLNKFECELFSITIPDGFYYKKSENEATDGSGYIHELLISKDSLDEDCTVIKWKNQNLFPGTARDFANVIAYLEMEDFESQNRFYDIMLMDSTYTIDNYPTYSVTSIFTENGDTILTCRTAIVVPDKFDMMITQRVNTTRPDVNSLCNIHSDIINDIKFNK